MPHDYNVHKDLLITGSYQDERRMGYQQYPTPSLDWWKGQKGPVPPDQPVNLEPSTNTTFA